MRAVLGAVCSVVLLAGCGGAVSGESAPAGPAPGDPVFSPCDDIPDDAIREVGMDPATKSRDILDVHQPGWNICGWNSDQYSLSVFSTVYTFDDLRNNSEYEDFEAIQAGDRDALAFRSTAYPASQRSYLALRSAEGMVMVVVTDWDEDPAKQAPARVVLEATRTLLPHLPQ
ncbi:DUF3558 domain-containing protein [Rhodococcus spongiicola]|uniref:DUF3558 domain-containing protein n=1 Tax=Rhodococcus spongiicola TaxID=2487352 RepID=UPI0013E3B43F|nr:DUF3558 domain-containing protein [Rhodococcus spongiicola]